jgi:uncharacterized protein (DUF2147 family)
MLIALAAAALTPIGLWDTPVDHGRIRVEPCGPQICGYVVSSTRLTAEPDQKDIRNENPALRARTVQNLKVVEVKESEPGAWKGWVYDPSSGRTYRVTLRMAPGDHVELTGCLIGPLCRTQSWTRAPGG